MPRLDLRAARLCSHFGRLLLEEPRYPPGPQAVLHLRSDQIGAPCQPVPPTVMRSMRNVGWPTPTGTPCPFLPQVPMPGSSARSLPIMLMRLRSVGPLPISIAPLSGERSLPSSIRYASVTLKTYLPDVISTCPPPKFTAKM